MAGCTGPSRFLVIFTVLAWRSHQIVNFWFKLRHFQESYTLLTKSIKTGPRKKFSWQVGFRNCHRDDHCLVRDAALMPPGAATRGNASRFGKRRSADGQHDEAIDQQTRKVRRVRTSWGMAADGGGGFEALAAEVHARLAPGDVKNACVAALSRRKPPMPPVEERVRTASPAGADLPLAWGASAARGHFCKPLSAAARTACRRCVCG